MQINNQDKVANDANTLSGAISAIKNAVWALDIYSNKKIQLIITLIGSTPNAVKEQWQDKQVRFFAYLYKPHKDVGVDVGIGERIEEFPTDVISLHFNGKLLRIIVNKSGKEVERIAFQAVSGRPQKVGDKYYFTYEKERQMLKSERPIPEGEYYITPLSENINDGVQEWDNLTNIDKLLAYTGRGKWGGRIYDWGTIRIPIQPKIVTLTDSKGQLITRNNFFIHGGAEAGSAGCVDLWDKNELFFEKFLHYVEKYKEEILNNQGKIPLIVKYENNTIMECDNDFYTKYCKPID